MTRIHPPCDARVVLKLLVCGVVLASTSVASLQNYLDSLSSIVSQTQTDHPHSGKYLNPLDRSETISHVPEIFEEPPDDHYAKDHFGAGWAGYKHPLYGGYLDHLYAHPEDDTVTATPATAGDPTGVGILPVGKKTE